VVACAIVIGTLLYTQNIVQRLQAREREVADLYAKSLEYVANEKTSGGDYSFIFNEIIRAIDFPIILTDPLNNPLPQYSKTVRNVPLDTTRPMAEQEKFLRKLIAKMDATYPPIKVTFQDTILLQYVHYDESYLVTELRWLPYIELGIAGLFVLMGYIGFSYIKRSEQSNIWVGLAKETAHQLGTPLSSMMGWTELIKMHSSGNPKLEATAAEMEQDLQRLNKIAARFSKIGSKPDLREENLNDVICGIIKYFEKRIPQTGKHISLAFDSAQTYTAKINRGLFEWVLENLVKNALDAIEDEKGRISFGISEKGNALYIDVSDTGKGIEPKRRKDIFRTGYSTKQRGWGLGLSLSKRIIENYHKGKLSLKESTLRKGTTFRIKLLK
ncbi:MAG: HAMP domain-containing sensor histidine kinase, partial [Bacteroidota bacterium]